MKKEILSELYSDATFDINSVIQINGIIYEDYIACPSQDLTTEKITTINILTSKENEIDISKILGPTTSMIKAKGVIKESGYFVYDAPLLLEELSNYGNELYNNIDTNSCKNYILNNLKKEPPLIDKLYIDIKSTILNIIINFFREFGFPFANKITNNYSTNTFYYYFIEYQVIPYLLLIYIVNTIYKNITFLETKDLTDDDGTILNNIFNQLNTFKEIFNINTNLFENKLVDTYNYYDEIKRLLGFYKIDLLNIINQFPATSIIQHTYFDYDSEKNKTISKSDNLLDLVWSICRDVILSNFELVKTRKCKNCGKRLTGKQSRYCSTKCRDAHGGGATTKKNKKEKISKMYTKGKDYIFEDFSINEKMIEFEELINTGKINNIDEHKYLIKTELDPLEEKINEAIKNKKCTKKVE